MSNHGLTNDALEDFSMLEEPWSETIPAMLEYQIPVPEPFTQGQLAHAQRAVDMWFISLDWVIQKEWNSKHKIPASNQLISVLKPRSIVLRHIYALCEKCHGLQNRLPERLPYSDASEWFKLVFYDLLKHSLEFEWEKSTEIRYGNRKQAALAIPREEVTRLSFNQNPCNKKFKALWELMDAGIRIAKQSDAFKKQHWTPYIKALSAYNTARSTPKWQRVIHEEGKAYIHLGAQGKGRRRLEPLPVEPFEA